MPFSVTVVKQLDRVFNKHTRIGSYRYIKGKTPDGAECWFVVVRNSTDEPDVVVTKELTLARGLQAITWALGRYQLRRDLFDVNLIL